MYQFLKKTNELITVSKAQELMELNTYKRQRRIKRHQVLFLSEKITEKEFRTCDIGVAIIGDQQVLVNGQHQLSAIIETGMEQYGSIEYYLCKDEKDLAHLFRQYDQHTRRSLEEMVYAEMGALGITCQKEYVKNMLSGIRLSNKLRGQWDSKYDIYGYHVRKIKDYMDELSFIIELFDNKLIPKHMRRAPVFASIVESFWKKEKHGYDFWQNVRSGEMLASDDPEKVLRDFLLNVSMSKYSSVLKRNVMPNDIFYRCNYTFNAWQEGRKVKRIKYSPQYSIPVIK